MRFEISEHNCIARKTAELAAAELRQLFSEESKLPPLSRGESSTGIPPLVESLEDAPPQPITPYSNKFPVYAIDGGSSVLAKGGNIEVIAWRAGYVRFEECRRQDEYCPPPQVMAYNRLASTEIIQDYLAGSSFREYLEQAPIRIVDDLRWLGEWSLLEELIEKSTSDTLILIDGSLRIHPGFDADIQHHVLAKAADKGVHVIAVTKTSSISLNSVMPIDIANTHNRSQVPSVWYRKLSKDIPNNSPWVGHIFIANLHPDSEKPYRIDTNKYDTTPFEQLMGMLSSLADDPEFVGYPYPLAAAHRLARIDTIFKQSMRDAIEEALSGKNFPPGLWTFLTGDIHEKLNADVMELI